MKVPDDHYHCIDKAMAMKLTVSDLKDILTYTLGVDEVQYGVRTITRVRYDLGWSFMVARYCQAICEANKTKRLDWCSDRNKEKETFDNVILMSQESNWSTTKGRAFGRRPHES